MGRKGNLESQLDRIIYLVIRQEYVTGSFVQRKLGIGYLSAMNVLKKLEELGYIEKGIINQKNALELRRNNLEDALLDGTIDRDTFKRRHSELQQQILNLDDQILELDNKSKIDIDLIEEVLAFTRNIHQAYLEAPQFLKRHYLRFFFEQFVVKNRKIYKVVPTPIFKILKNRHEIIIRNVQLERWDDFYGFNWLEVIDYPDVVIQQTHQLLSAY